jgi:glycosidase
MVALTLVAGCARPAPARCALTAWYRPSSVAREVAARGAPELVGSWNGWARPGLGSFVDVRAGDGTLWRRATLDLLPATYQYAIAFGAARMLDELNPRTAFVAGEHGPFDVEVSEAVLDQCAAAQLSVVSASSVGQSLTVTASFTPGADGVPLDARSLSATLLGAGVALAQPVGLVALAGSGGGLELRARADGLAAGKYGLTLSARDRLGRSLSAQASAFVATAVAPALPGDQLIYQLMIDRFWGPNGALAPPATPGDRAGGTLDGVRAAIESGYFERLGVTTLWLSPLYRNPDAHLVGRDGHLVTPYHGYWPSAPRAVDPALGGEAALEALVAAAHARGLRLLADVVPHHVFEAHPYYVEHSRQASGVVAAPTAATPAAAVSWFFDSPAACVCGAPGCDWGAHLTDCWFDAYLPTLDWRHPQVMAAGTADLVWWMSRFDLDGVRVDAVPMMPRAASRRIVHALHALGHRAPVDEYVLGEVFTGAGEGGRSQIRAFLGSALDGLDGAFDFPLMWAIRDVIAHGESDFAALEEEVAASARAWDGSGATMALIIGNHDTTRFVSEANGDAGGDPWSAPPAQPTDAAPYQRQLVALAFTLTLPGAPVLYYGDELGLAGGADPDSRRVLPDVHALGPAQAQLYAAVQALGRARACAAALRSSERNAVYVGADHDIILRRAGDGSAAIVVLSRADAPATLAVAGLPAGRYRDVIAGATLSIAGEPAAIVAPPLSAAVYLPEGSECLH